MSSPLSIPALIDREPMRAYQWRIFALCFLIAIFDGFDTQAIAFTGPAIIQAFNLADGALAPILTAGTVGMVIGAMTLGLIGDKIGRRPALLGGIAVFALASLATAFSTTTDHILVLRFIAGLGMGGCTPVLLALAAEYGPARFRGAIMTGVLLGLPGGAIVGGLLAAKMLPVIGWEGIFVVGGVAPLILLGVLLVALPESMQYLVGRGGDARLARVRRTLARIVSTPLPADATYLVPEAAARTSVASLFSGANARNTIAIWVTYFFNWIAWFMLLSWLPTVLKASGLPAEEAPMGTVVVNSVFILCAIPLSMLLPRLNTRRLLLALFVFGVAISVGLGYSGTNWSLVFVLVGAAGLGVGGQQIALNYLVAGAYPTALRATAIGSAIGVGRMGAIVGSAIGGIFLATGGPAGFYFALAVPLLVATLAVLAIRIGKPAADPALATAH